MSPTCSCGEVAQQVALRKQVSIDKKNITVGFLEWFYREAKPDGKTDKLPVLLLHGLPSQSHSWTVIMPALATAGYRAIAPD